MNPFLKSKVEQKMRVLTVVWFAILASPFMFAVVLFQPNRAPADPQPLSEMFKEPMALVFALASLGAIVAARVLSSLFLSRERLQTLLKKPWTAEALAAERVEGRPVYGADEIPKYLEFTERERVIWLGFGPYFLAKIVTFALSESAAVMGFLLASQSHQPKFYLPFLALALVSLLMARPSEADYNARVSV